MNGHDLAHSRGDVACRKAGDWYLLYVTASLDQNESKSDMATTKRTSRRFIGSQSGQSRLSRLCDNQRFY